MSGLCLRRDLHSDRLSCFYGVEICSYRLSTCLRRHEHDECECTFDPYGRRKQLELLENDAKEAHPVHKAHHIDPLQIIAGEIAPLPHGPAGFCAWTGGKNAVLVCYFRARRCSEDLQECRGRNDRCTCQWQPYTLEELAKGKFVNRAQRRYEPSQKRGPLAIPRNRVLALIYPNGYCSMTGGKGPRLRCFHRRRACSDLLSDCQYKWQPCMCQFNPYPPEESGKKQLSIVAPKKAQTNIHEKGISRRAVDKYDSTDQAYPNGFCRIRTGNTPGLMCHIKRRMCSYREDVCHHFRGPCICEFNPYGPVENLPTRKKLIKEALAHARPKTHIKSDGNKRRKIESQAQGRTHSPQPVGYCRWTRGRSLTLACYHHQRQCSFITGVCQHPQDPCMCSFNPYTASPILVQKQTPTKAEKSPINAHKSPLVQRPFSARAKQSPNNAASPPPVLRRPTTRIKQPPNNDAKESWLYRSKSTKATDVGGTAVSELVFPHGYCRRQSTREAELRCYIGQRMCSVEKESCRAAWEPCVCVYDPYKKIWW